MEVTTRGPPHTSTVQSFDRALALRSSHARRRGGLRGGRGRHVGFLLRLAVASRKGRQLQGCTMAEIGRIHVTHASQNWFNMRDGNVMLKVVHSQTKFSSQILPNLAVTEHNSAVCGTGGELKKEEGANWGGIDQVRPPVSGWLTALPPPKIVDFRKGFEISYLLLISEVIPAWQQSGHYGTFCTEYYICLI